MTYANPVVPKSDIVLPPLEAHMKLLSGSYYLVQIVDDSIAFGFGNTNDLGNETRIEEYRVPASDRVGADERMFGSDWLTTDSTT